MTTEEFLAMSLPYGVKMVSNNGDNNYIAILDGIQNGIYYDEYGNEFDDYKPILHPLSDLTKEIEHKGEKFVPIIELIKIKYSILLDLQDEDFSIYTDGYPRACYTTNAIWGIMINPDYLPNEEFWIVQKLVEWHFDIADLISKGEAIDVNTLETNPYK